MTGMNGGHEAIEQVMSVVTNEFLTGGIEDIAVVIRRGDETKTAWTSVRRDGPGMMALLGALEVLKADVISGMQVSRTVTESDHEDR